MHNGANCLKNGSEPEKVTGIRRRTVEKEGLECTEEKEQGCEKDCPGIALFVLLNSMLDFYISNEQYLYIL